VKKKLWSFLIFLMVQVGTIISTEIAQECSFVFVIPSYKNIRWYKRNLDSVMMQERTYSNWRAVYIDDCSPDGTGQAVEEYVRECGFEHKITVIRNDVRVGALANLYRAIHSCRDDEIVCTLDGDDWLVLDNALCILNDFYSDPNVWIVYGQFREWPSGKIGLCRTIPDRFIKTNAFRNIPWMTSHLRTFYAWLFKRIKKEDLMKDGQFFAVAWDLAIMFPMLEMAGERIRCNPTVVYEYNMDNPINDWKKSLRLVLRTDRFIRSKERYQRLGAADIQIPAGEQLC
jgi:glycosyltransferase involved in cell wall biosynthesis